MHIHKFSKVILLPPTEDILKRNNYLNNETFRKSIERGNRRTLVFTAEVVSTRLTVLLIQEVMKLFNELSPVLKRQKI